MHTPNPINLTLNVFMLLVLILSQPAMSADESPASARQDTIMSPRQAYMYLRGLKQDYQAGSTPWTWTKSASRSAARMVISGIEFTSSFGMRMLNDDQFVESVEDFFFTDNRSFGWYPVGNFVSGFRPRIGANLIAHISGSEWMLRGRYADVEKYQLETRAAYRFQFFGFPVRMSFRAITSRDDDRKFYGFGRDPDEDPRSAMQVDSDHTYGLFHQEYAAWDMTLGLRPIPKIQAFLTYGTVAREITGSGDDRDRFNAIFDTSRLQGYFTEIDHRFIETILRLDTRQPNRYLAPGWRVQSRIRYNHGVETDKSRFIRTGFDISGSVPILLHNRIVQPRLVIESIYGLSSIDRIPFSEYPNHSTFRGVSERVMLRTDTHVIVPSLEYIWPISVNISSHLFLDSLIAAKSISKINLDDAPWAIGLGMDFHVRDQELVKVEAAVGPYGFHGSADIGWSF